MNLTQIAADLKAHFESVEKTAAQFLEAHVPEVENWARWAETSPLVASVSQIVGRVSPEAEAVLAEALTKLASLAPAPAAEPVAPAEAEQPPPAG